jgi:hypothetical protein
MPRAGAIIAALMTALVFSVTCAASASAESSWFIQDTKLVGTAKLASTASVQKSFEISIPAAKVVVTCSAKTFSDSGFELVATAGARAHSLTFEGCATTEPSKGCELTTSTIATEPITGTARSVTKTSEDRLTLSPQTKNLLANLDFAEANTCAFNTQEPLKGALTMDMPTGQYEEEEQELESLGTLENNSLETAGDKTYFKSGGGTVRVQSGTNWLFGACGGGLTISPSRWETAKPGEEKEITLKNDNCFLSTEVTEAKFTGSPAAFKISNGATCVEHREYGIACDIKVLCEKEGTEDLVVKQTRGPNLSIFLKCKP